VQQLEMSVDTSPERFYIP